PGVVAADDGVPNAVQEAGAPLRAEACPPGASGFGDPFVVLHVLSYRDLPRLPAAHLVVHPLQQAPAVRNIGTGIVVAAPEIADPADGVEPQTVAMALLEPAQDIVAQELAHLAAAVIRPRAPRRCRAPVIVEVDASEPVLFPAVELPQFEIVRTQLVVNQVVGLRVAVRIGG